MSDKLSLFMSLLGWFHTTAFSVNPIPGLVSSWESGLYLILMLVFTKQSNPNNAMESTSAPPVHHTDWFSNSESDGMEELSQQMFSYPPEIMKHNEAVSAIDDDSLRALLVSGSRCHWATSTLKSSQSLAWWVKDPKHTTEIQTPHKTKPRELLHCLHRQLPSKTTETTLYTLKYKSSSCTLIINIHWIFPLNKRSFIVKKGSLDH